ncbi:MAG TPA: IS607 family transposase [Actinophytocola sp.]|uniref:IS607 family transposase n=1 Tax=Actinophytocola sp. TaxID=1872138 RepID=UPI002E047573|nr:IS607 family transposase [Actinophytocola sp.]
MNLKEWARRQGVHPTTAYRWFREGTLPVPARQVGRLILVEAPEPGRVDRTVVYCRVSSADQKDDLERQAGRVTAWTAGQGLAVSGVVSEIGSGLSGHRSKLLKLLADPSATVIVVEHRDRLARFGVECIEAALAGQGRRLLVVDPAETTDDLVRDMIDVMTSLCARLYGRRSAKTRARKAVEAAAAG